MDDVSAEEMEQARDYILQVERENADIRDDYADVLKENEKLRARVKFAGDGIPELQSVYQQGPQPVEWLGGSITKWAAHEIRELRARVGELETELSVLLIRNEHSEAMLKIFEPKKGGNDYRR
jgi:hypothetical protein